MRRFLLFLFLLVPLAVAFASPTFWSIWRMKTSTERVGYGQRDGTVQWAQLGPKSPWPDWALVPVGTTIRVGASFEATATQPAMGFGSIVHGSTPAAVQRDYVRQLEADGWQVSPNLLDTALPEIPPRRVRMCNVDATKGNFSLRLSVSDAPASGLDRLQWTAGKSSAKLIGSTTGFCPVD